MPAGDERVGYCDMRAVGGDEAYFGEAARLAREGSNCLKINTGAVVVLGGKIVGRGYNRCSPDGFKFAEKVGECKRMKVPTGTGYELCKSIHAEVAAIVDAGAKRCQGATLYLSGHYYPCWQCESLAKASGIVEIKVRDVGAKKFYQKSKMG